MTVHDQTEAIFEQMLDMTDADISVLQAALSGPAGDMHMTTLPGSANSRLWSAMEGLGWLTRRASSLPSPSGPAVAMEHFATLPHASAALGELMASWTRLRSGRATTAGRPAHLNDAMTRIANEVSATFGPDLVRRVRDAGGDMNDVIIMLSFTLSRAINGWIQPDARMTALERIAQAARDQLKR